MSAQPYTEEEIEQLRREWRDWWAIDVPSARWLATLDGERTKYQQVAERRDDLMALNAVLRFACQQLLEHHDGANLCSICSGRAPLGECITNPRWHAEGGPVALAATGLGATNLREAIDATTQS